MIRRRKWWMLSGEVTSYIPFAGFAQRSRRLSVKASSQRILKVDLMNEIAERFHRRTSSSDAAPLSTIPRILPTREVDLIASRVHGSKTRGFQPQCVLGDQNKYIRLIESCTLLEASRSSCLILWYQNVIARGQSRRLRKQRQWPDCHGTRSISTTTYVIPLRFPR